MKKGFFQTLVSGPVFFSVFLLIPLSISPHSAWASRLENLSFKHDRTKGMLELNFDDPHVIAKRFHVPEDKQIIVDLENVTAPEKVIRGFDTSEFLGSIVYVNAYKRPNSEADLRIAIQLRDNVRSRLLKEGNKITLEVENRFGSLDLGQVDLTKPQGPVDVKTQNLGATNAHKPKSQNVTDILNNITMSGRKKYVGKRITINVKDVSVEDILKMIADASGFNIILTSAVKSLPPLTLNLTNVPWDQALDTILNLNKLVASRNGIILMVKTLEEVTEDKRKEAAASKLTEREEPLVTKIFPISYADTEDLTKLLGEYLTKDRGKIGTDVRTNSIIVKDTPEAIERLKKIVELLDKQTPQVLIESKIVEVIEEYSKEIGLESGLNFGYDPIGDKGSSAASVIGTDVTAGTNGGPGFSFSSAPATGDGARSFFGLQVTRFNRLLNLDFSLQLMESESKAKVVASPKVITQNKKKATIQTTDTTSYTESLITDGATTETFKEAKSSLSLDVTPQVTNEGSIVLEIAIDKEQFGTRPSTAAPPDKQGRKVETNVLVENGSTIVLGGIYSFRKEENHSGVPVLKDLPLIGWLFRTAYNPSTSKSELIIFLTPRIVNQEEAGLIDQG